MISGICLKKYLRRYEISSIHINTFESIIDYLVYFRKYDIPYFEGTFESIIRKYYDMIFTNRC